MKKYVALLISALLLGSLWGCAAPAPDAANAADPALSDTASAEPSASVEPSAPAEAPAAALAPVTTEEEVRAPYTPNYEADRTTPPILSVTEYEGGLSGTAGQRA